MGEVIPESTGEWVFVEGGMGRITEIIEKIAKNRGVTIKTESPVN
jgi:phytoene dehydrogenase-like protein